MSKYPSKITITLSDEIARKLENQSVGLRLSKAGLARTMIETMVKFYGGDQSGFRIIVDENNKIRIRGVAQR